MTKDVKEIIKKIENIEPKEIITPISGTELKERLEDKTQTFHNCPGIYKWWATENQLKDFKKNHGEAESKNNGDYETCELNGKTLYCIYVGKALGQSLRKRLEHYVKNRDTSTVRKQIGEIIGEDVKSEKVTEYINKLYVSCDAYELKIKSEETDILCMILETHEINRFYRICNKSVNYRK